MKTLRVILIQSCDSSTLAKVQKTFIVKCLPQNISIFSFQSMKHSLAQITDKAVIVNSTLTKITFMKLTSLLEILL